RLLLPSVDLVLSPKRKPSPCLLSAFQGGRLGRRGQPVGHGHWPPIGQWPPWPRVCGHWPWPRNWPEAGQWPWPRWPTRWPWPSVGGARGGHAPGGLPGTARRTERHTLLGEALVDGEVPDAEDLGDRADAPSGLVHGHDVLDVLFGQLAHAASPRLFNSIF